MSGIAIETSGYDEALAFLYGRIDYERSDSLPEDCQGLHLDRMRSLLDHLGNPQQHLRIIHVAGTKGKGSTAAMISSCLAAAQFQVGLYTSPHLERLEERFAVDSKPCSKADLVDLTCRVAPAVAALDAKQGQAGPTFFDITTAMAMLHFATMPVDFAVLEVGLGGRLDSTNVCEPALAVITSISLDHTRQLGNTLFEIAQEKAGIIKPGVAVVSGVVDDEPRSAIRAAAKRAGSHLYEAGVDFSYDYVAGETSRIQPAAGRVAYREPSDASPVYSEMTLGLLGRHQAANAAVAIATLRRISEMGYRVPEEAIRLGLRTARVPARVEFIGRVVLDTSHNVASVQALTEVLREVGAVSKRVLLFSTSREKDARGMLRELLPEFDAAVLTRYSENPRAMDTQQLGELALQLASSSADIQVVSKPEDALEECQRLAGKDGLICVTGSFFLAAELRDAISLIDESAEGQSRQPFRAFVAEGLKGRQGPNG
jgi:dihydrofolate synthase/folylpolyglutamate synthase